MGGARGGFLRAQSLLARKSCLEEGEEAGVVAVARFAS